MLFHHNEWHTTIAFCKIVDHLQLSASSAVTVFDSSMTANVMITLAQLRKEVLKLTFFFGFAVTLTEMSLQE